MTTLDERPPARPTTPQDGPVRSVLIRALPGCQADTISQLVRMVRMRHFKPGEQIYRQGEPVPLTIILDGYGAARRTTASGKELVNGVARAGVLFGWSGLASVPSSVELLALTECEVAQWRGADIRALAAIDNALALAAIDSMAWSMHQMVERIEGFLHQDARLGVLRILAQYRDLFFGETAVLTRNHLPGLVGTSREMTGHVLRQLEREGVVERFGRTGLRLLRPDQLEAVAP